MNTVYLLIVVFFPSADGIPEMKYTAVTGTRTTCERAAGKALQPIAAIVGERNIISVSCTKKHPYADNPHNYPQ